MVEDGVGHVDAGYGAVRDIRAETGRDGAGAAVNVEGPVVREDVREKEGGVLSGRLGGVRTGDRRMVALRIVTGICVVVCHGWAERKIPDKACSECSCGGALKL